MRRWTLLSRDGADTTGPSTWWDVLKGPAAEFDREGVDVVPASYTEEDVERVAKAVLLFQGDVISDADLEHARDAARTALDAFLEQ